MLNLLYTKFKTLGKLILFYKGNTISNDYTSKIALEMKIGQKRIRMQMRQNIFFAMLIDVRTGNGNYEKNNELRAQIFLS